MKTLIIITLLFFTTHLFGQPMKVKEIETYVKEINSLKAKNKLQEVSYSDMSACDGGLYGYYYNEKLILIESTYQAEAGFSSKTIYLKEDTLFVHISYREHFAEWEKYYQKYPSEKYEWDPNKMTYTDTLYTIALSDPISFTKQAGDKIITKTIDTKLIDALVRCGHEMKKDLDEAKTSR